MRLEEILGPGEVSLEEILDERDFRAAAGRRLGRRLHENEALVVFTMNMAGPVKSFPLLLAAYQEGRCMIEKGLDDHDFPWILLEERRSACGPCAFYQVFGDALAVKGVMCEIEDRNPMTRLFDIDVTNHKGQKLSRTELGKAPRGCLICGQPAFICGRSRRHTVLKLQEESVNRMLGGFQKAYAERIAGCAYKAMIDEVSLTPKPGLVDRDDNGAHQDMDYACFMKSADAIAPYFGCFARLGFEQAELKDEELFQKAKVIGVEAETAMYQATGGINTHKGLIYSMGLMAVAAGALKAEAIIHGRTDDPDEACIRQKASRLAVCSLPELQSDTGSHGSKVYRRYQAKGVRAEAAAGFPSVSAYVLPNLAKSDHQEIHAKIALLELMAHVEDTNVLYRGGSRALDTVRTEAARALDRIDRAGNKAEEADEELGRLNRLFQERGISPGGSADLLAAGMFLHKLKPKGNHRNKAR